MHELFAMKAKEGDDIIAHLTSLKQLWVHITTVCYKNPPFNAKQFKKLLIYILPASWDDFTWQFSRDPNKKNLDIYIFIGECYEEYRRRQQRECEEGTVTAYAALKSNLRFLKKKQNLNQIKQHCDHCCRNNHKIEDCYHASKPKCTVCKRLGHEKETCRIAKKKQMRPQKPKDKLVANVITPKKETNIAETK